MKRALVEAAGLRSLGVVVLVLLFAAAFNPPTAAAIYRWDNGELITEKDAEPGADLSGMDLSYADLVDALLRSASFSHSGLTAAHLMSADLRLSDLRRAEISASQIASAASVRGTILRDGRIEGLMLDAGEQLVVRDDNGYSDESTPRDSIPITVDSVMRLDPAAILNLILEDDDWGSTISFEPGVSVSLDGTLKLTFGDIPRPADLVGTTFYLFDWDGAMVTGTFDRIVTEPDSEWDTANLYTNGQVTLLSADILFGDVNLDGTVNGLNNDPCVAAVVGSLQQTKESGDKSPHSK